MEEKIICPICGKEFIGDQYDECPICEWGYVGYEDIIDKDKVEGFNSVSINQAKHNFAKGLNVRGEPLKKAGFATFEQRKN